MKLDGKELETDKEKCDAFNQFFCSVFTKAKQITELSIFEKAKYNHIELNKDCMEKIMLELDINKATGPDNLGNLVYTNLAKTVSKLVLLIFQTFLDKGIFAETWKLSEVVPIFKDRNKCDNKRYIPISLLCGISKIFEKFYLTTFMKECDIIFITLHMVFVKNVLQLPNSLLTYIKYT